MILNYIKKLKDKGVIGINQRNLDLINKYNAREYYPLVDDKVLTKQKALEHGISVPELYAVITTERELKSLELRIAKLVEFVIKPAKGTGGDGILVITGRVGNKYRKSNGEALSFDDIRQHISDIISGMYSLGGRRDKAMLEYLILPAREFAPVCYQGVPDIRVILLKGYPIMAMLRLPTRISSGKANLHQGAVGVGVDLQSGTTMTGVWQNELIAKHPDTDNLISSLEIPKWDEVLELASECYDFTGLGYLGVDIVIDENKGPMVLEVNARPGLSIQIANQTGLQSRIQSIEKLSIERNFKERITYAKVLFKEFSQSIMVKPRKVGRDTSRKVGSGST